MKSTLPLGLLLAWTAGFCPAAGEETPGRMFRRPGLEADRETRVVRLEARATGIEPGLETEFFLIAPDSGHDYEAIAVARARPSEVHEAMEFIGMQPGRPVHPDALHFWPRGERVVAWVERANGERMRLEDTIWDRRTDSPTPREGFVFTGSVRVKEPGGEGRPARTVYAADEYSPQAIISAFNLRTTVFDIPRAGSKEDLYPVQVSHAGAAFGKDEPLVIVLEPERREGPPRVMDLRLELVPGPDLRFLVSRGAEGEPLERSAAETARQLAQWREEERDLFVELAFPGAATLEEAQAASRFFAPLVHAGTLRPEPPPPGGFYYRAFLPSPEMRTRIPHQVRPWEVILPAEGPGLRLVRTRTEWDEAGAPRVTERTFEAASPEEAAEIVGREGRALPALLVFAPGALSLETLRERLSPLLRDHPHLFFFAE